MDSLLRTPLGKASRWLLAASLELAGLAAIIGFVALLCIAMGGR